MPLENKKKQMSNIARIEAQAEIKNTTFIKISFNCFIFTPVLDNVTHSRGADRRIICYCTIRPSNSIRKLVKLFRPPFLESCTGM